MILTKITTLKFSVLTFVEAGPELSLTSRFNEVAEGNFGEVFEFLFYTIQCGANNTFVFSIFLTPKSFSEKTIALFGLYVFKKL